MNILKLLSITIFISALSTSGFSQTLIKKEDRAGRLRHEYKMSRNPETGNIPENIRKNELQYVNSEKSKLTAKRKTSSNGRVLSNALDWETRGPFNQGGRTKAIGVDSRDENIILAGGTSGGMFRTTDGGASWTSVTNPLDNPSITGVAQDPLAQDTWYYITGEAKESVNTNQSSQIYIGDGVYKSTDNGITWSQLSSTDPENTVLEGEGARSDWQLCHEIVIDPISGAILVTNIGGVYRSNDAGVSWTIVLDAAGLINFGDVTHIDVAEVDTDNSIYYASTHSSGTNKGFFRSTDGVSWTQLTNPPGFGGEWERILVSIAKSNTDVAWFLASGSQLSPETIQLLKYDHSTTTWTDFTDKIPALGGSVGDFNTQNSYNMVMAVKPDNENAVFIAGTKLWRSTDAFTSSILEGNTGNSTWIGGYSPDNDINAYPGHHPDVHELVFFPNNPDKVLCGHDGGLSVTTDIMANDGIPEGKSKPHPVTWTLLNNGLFTTQAYAISIDPTTSGSSNIVAGFQDNGNYRTTQDGESTPWTEEPYGGDGAWNATAPGGDTWYISQQYGTVQRNSESIFYGPGVNPASAGTSTTNSFISPFILDRVDPDIMYYAANTDLWRNNSISTIGVGEHPFNGTSEGWTELTLSSSLNGEITALETSITPANVLYIGTSSGEVYRIDDANTETSITMTDIFTGKGLSSGFISSIDVDPDDADNVFITYSNYEIISIYNSTDAGSTWTNISGNLEENVDGSGSGPGIRWVHVFKQTDNSNVYYIGATTGLYATETLEGINTVWTQEGTSTIGNVPISMIRSRQEDGYIAVGTHGKGMFSTNFAGTSDVTAPTVTTLSPADGASDVATDSDLVITFSENVVDGGGNIIIKKESDDSVVESIAVASSNITIADAMVTITPTNEFDGLIAYYIEIEASAFEDESGNSFVGISDKTSWNFTTEETADVIAPTVVTFSPVDGASDVATGSDLVITFNENVVDGGGNVIIKKESDDSVVESIAVASNNITITDATVTIAPTSDLENLIAYYVEIEASAFEDESGNSFAGISDKTSWNFTTEETADVIAPTVATFSPVDGASDVATGSDLVITFSENVVDGGGNVIIKKESDDSIVESIAVSSNNITIADAIVTITPTSDFDDLIQYYVEIDATAFEDESGNSYLGISDKTTWDFTTEGIDITAPTITDLSPDDGDDDIAVDTELEITFSENVVDAGGNIIIKQESDDSIVESIAVDSDNVTIDDEVVTITPTDDFEGLIEYYIEIEDSAFEDESGNPFAGISSKRTWEFTTEATDTTAPIITDLSPADGADDVAIDADIVITFDEPIIASGGDIILKTADGSVVETIRSSSNDVDIDDTEVSIFLSNDFLASTDYYIEIDADAFSDIAENTFAGISDNSTWSFTTQTILDIEGVSIKNRMIVVPIEYGVQVKFLDSTINEAEINLYNLDGKLATYRSLAKMKDNTTHIKATLKPGVYILVASTDEGIFTKKFIVK